MKKTFFRIRFLFSKPLVKLLQHFLSNGPRAAIKLFGEAMI